MTGLPVLLTRLGLDEPHIPLVREALTHRSMAGETSYERLEFLGDRALGLVAALRLMADMPSADEGTLSLRHTALVRWQTCAAVGEAWHIWPLVRHALPAKDVTEAVRARIVADVVEALLGVVIQVRGMDAVVALMRRDWPMVGDAHSGKDAKTALQELLQARKLAVPEYTVVDATGPDHARRFVVEMTCPLGHSRGEGASKAQASLSAAENFMESMTL